MSDCFNLSYVDILNKLKHVFMLMQYLDIMDSQRRGICLFGKCLFIHYRICERPPLNLLDKSNVEPPLLSIILT